MPIARHRGRSDVSCDILAGGSGLITFLATSGGLFLVVPRFQSAVVAGIAVGLMARGILDAGLIGIGVSVLGSLVAPGNAWFANAPHANPTLAIVVAVVTCAVVAVGARLAAARAPQGPHLLLGAALVVLIANMWGSPLVANARQLYIPSVRVQAPSFNQQLSSRIDSRLSWQDGAFFFRVYKATKSSGDFYAEYAREMRRTFGSPRSVVNFRMPTLFIFWRALPSPRAIVLAFLSLATLAVLCVLPLSAPTVRLPLVIPGCAAVAAYLMQAPSNVLLFEPEEWAAMLGVFALTAHALSARSARWRAWTILATAFAVLAVLSREAIAFLALAGLVSAFVGAEDQRRFRIVSWGVGLAVLIAAFTGQYLATRPYLVPGAAASGFGPHFGSGGVAFMLSALQMGTDYIGRGGCFPYALAAIGVVGALSIPDNRVRVFAGVTVLATLASFLVVGNNAWDLTAQGSRTAVNFWGIVLVPMLYALVPTSFALIPAARPAPISNAG